MLKKSLVLIASISILAFSVVTATADTTFSGKLSGAQAVPPNGSTAVGFGTIILNSAETRITISLDFSGLGSNQTAAHIHGPAAPGAHAPILFNLGSQGTTSGAFGNLSAAVTPRQVAQLKAGRWYFDVHSTRLFAGEIRAQILPGGEVPANDGDVANSGVNRVQADELNDEPFSYGRLSEVSQLLMNDNSLKLDEHWNEGALICDRRHTRGHRHGDGSEFL